MTAKKKHHSALHLDMSSCSASSVTSGRAPKAPLALKNKKQKQTNKKKVIKLGKKKGRQLTAGLGGGVFKPHANDPNRSSNGSLVLSNKT